MFVIDSNRVVTSGEVRQLIATRNRPMLMALDLCIEALEGLGGEDDAVHVALRCARKAAEMERRFQAWLRSD